MDHNTMGHSTMDHNTKDPNMHKTKQDYTMGRTMDPRKYQLLLSSDNVD